MSSDKLHLTLNAADYASATVFLYIVLFSLSSQTTVLSVDSERRLLALFLLLFYWGNKMTFLFSPFLYLSQCVVVQIFCREFLQSSYWISGCPDQLGVLFVAGRGKMCYFSLPFFLQHFITSYSEFLYGFPTVVSRLVFYQFYLTRLTLLFPDIILREHPSLRHCSVFILRQ